MAEREYHRLTRSRSRTLFGIISTARSSLWLGKDHLLCIDTNGYSEVYKRFYYRDVQAIIWRKTALWHIWTALFSVAAVGFGLIAVSAASEPGASITFAIIAGFFFLGVVMNLAPGPTCKCYLRTAVQTEELASLNRLRRVRKALDRLRPFLIAAQGEMSPEQVRATIREDSSAIPAPEPAPTPPAEPLSAVSDAPTPKES